MNRRRVIYGRRVLVGTILGQALLVLMIFVLPQGGDRALTGVLYLLGAPALAVYLPLRYQPPQGQDALSAVVVAGMTAVVLNAVVAEVMVASGMWSAIGGVVAIAVISLLITVTGYVCAVRPQPSPSGSVRTQTWR